MRWRKASPNSPPEANDNNTLRNGLFSSELSRGIANRITNGTREIMAVERRAEIQISRRVLGEEEGFLAEFAGWCDSLVCCCGSFACRLYLKEGGSSMLWSCP